MTPEEERVLVEVRRILAGAYEETREAERLAILAAARPELAALRRGAHGSLGERGMRWLGRRLQNPMVRLASVTLAAAMILFFVLSRDHAAMRSSNVYTYQELANTRAGAPLGTSASVFQGLR